MTDTTDVDDLMIPGARSTGALPIEPPPDPPPMYLIGDGGIGTMIVAPLQAVPPARPAKSKRDHWNGIDRKVMGMHLTAATYPSDLSRPAAPRKPLLSRPYRWLIWLTVYALFGFGCLRLVTWAGRQALLG